MVRAIYWGRLAVEREVEWWRIRRRIAAEDGGRKTEGMYTTT
jgi:hypothetical protein